MYLRMTSSEVSMALPMSPKACWGGDGSVRMKEWTEALIAVRLGRVS